MNYIEQIKGFWVAQEANQLDTNEVALYFYLLEVCNRLAWADSFKRNNAKITADLSISFKTLQNTRNRLQQVGLISFKTQNGVPNVHYSLADLCKNSKGNGRGLGQGNGRGLGRDKINQTKPNQTKQSKSHSDANAPGEEKILFWKSFIAVWSDFYEKKFSEKFMYLKKDFAHFKKIHEFLRKRAEMKKMEFTQENLKASFGFFLEKAWDKDEWIRQNFTPATLLTKFNQIANGTESATNRRQTGAGVDMQSAYEKLNRMSN